MVGAQFEVCQYLTVHINKQPKQINIPKLTDKPITEHKFKYDNEITSYVIHKYVENKNPYYLYNTVIDYYPLTKATVPHIAQYI